MQIIRKLSLALGLATAVSVASIATAIADDFVPEFAPSKHVYIAPDAPKVPLPTTLADELAQATHGLVDVYVVVGNGAPRSAGPLSSEIFDHWSRGANFAGDRMLIITITGPNGESPVSIGARAGRELNAMGINRDLMNSRSGPIWAVAPYLNDHPEQIPLQITQSIVSVVEREQAQAKDADNAPALAAPRSSGGEDNTTLFVGIALMAIVFSIAGGVFSGSGSSSAESSLEIEKRETQKRAAEQDSKRKAGKALWEKLQALSLDGTPDSSRIKTLLCERLSIDEAAAAELVEEYKRFVFLSVHYAIKASPSKLVDEVWHLHLSEDTEAYYVTMCGGVLGKIFFHDPFQNMAAQMSGPMLYQRTLSAYREFFQTEPNPKFWPRS